MNQAPLERDDSTPDTQGLGMTMPGDMRATTADQEHVGENLCNTVNVLGRPGQALQRPTLTNCVLLTLVLESRSC